MNTPPDLPGNLTRGRDHCPLKWLVTLPAKTGIPPHTQRGIVIAENRAIIIFLCSITSHHMKVIPVKSPNPLAWC